MRNIDGKKIKPQAPAKLTHVIELGFERALNDQERTLIAAGGVLRLQLQILVQRKPGMMEPTLDLFIAPPPEIVNPAPIPAQEWEHEPAGTDSFGVPYAEFWRRGHETRTTPPEPEIVSPSPAPDRVVGSSTAPASAQEKE